MMSLTVPPREPPPVPPEPRTDPIPPEMPQPGGPAPEDMPPPPPHPTGPPDPVARAQIALQVRTRTDNYVT